MRDQIKQAEKEFRQADSVWREELRKVFGDSAEFIADTRYGRGEIGSELRRAYNARCIASDIWAIRKQFA